MLNLGGGPRGLCVLAVGCIAVVAGVSGCGGSAESREREQSNIKPLAVLYGQFLSTNRGQPPATEQQFKDYVKSRGPDLSDSYGVASVDELFVSSRDGKPYVIRSGAEAQQGEPGPDGSRVVIYEAEGVDGKRYVATAMGAVEEVDEARFKQLVPSGP